MLFKIYAKLFFITKYITIPSDSVSTYYGPDSLVQLFEFPFLSEYYVRDTRQVPGRTNIAVLVSRNHAFLFERHSAYRINVGRRRPALYFDGKSCVIGTSDAVSDNFLDVYSKSRKFRGRHLSF